MIYAPIFEASPQPDLRQILETLYQGRTLLPYSSGQAIALYADEVVIVCRGIVQLGTLYDSGDEALLGLACPSMPFGIPLTLIRPYQAQALTDIDVMRLKLYEVEQSPELAVGIFRQAMRRIQQTEAILALVGHRRVEDRLRHFLLLLKEQVGQAVDGGTRLSVRLTHQQMANAIGTTRVTVTRLLSAFKSEGWLAMDPSRHMIMWDLEN